MKHIIVGYDETPPAERALERAAELAKAFGAKLTVTSIAPVLVGAGRGIGPVDPADPPARHQLQLQHAMDKLTGLGLDAEVVVGIGDPARSIVSLAEDKSADLIVVGTREPGMLERLFGLSVSESVEHHAHCDVLIVH